MIIRNELDEKEFDRDFIDEYLKLLNPGSVICSAGCGPCGHVEDYVAKKGFNVIGIDISEKCVEIAKENHPGLKFEVGDAADMKYGDDFFDGLISYYSIIDTPKSYVNEVLGEFNRVLKKGGLLLLVLKEGKEEGYRKELLGIETEIYMSLFTEEETIKFLEGSSFEIIKMVTREPYAGEINMNRIFSISRKK